MKGLDVNKVDLREIELFGGVALFTEMRVKRDTVPKPLQVYDVRHDDLRWDEPVQIARGVLVNHLGTLITFKPLDLPDWDSRYLEPNEVDLYSGKLKTIEQFAKDHNIKLKPLKERTR